MNAHVKTFGSPSGEPSTTRSMLQQMCEKLWTLPRTKQYAEKARKTSRDKGRLHERDLRFVDLGRYLCEVRAGRDLRLDFRQA
jgi:hypothetical protein